MLKILWENIMRREKTNTAAVLKENVLFQDLTAKELQFVTHIVHIRYYRPGEVIFRQGAVGFGMYIIAEGAVEITAGPDRPTLLAEETAKVASLAQGDFFGELALVEENGKRSATATAVQDTRLIGFFKPDLLEILARKPATGVKITLQLCKVLGKRLIETNAYVARLNDSLTRRNDLKKCQ